MVNNPLLPDSYKKIKKLALIYKFFINYVNLLLIIHLNKVNKKYK